MNETLQVGYSLESLYIKSEPDLNKNWIWASTALVRFVNNIWIEL